MSLPVFASFEQFAFQVLLELAWIHAVGALIDVNKVGARAGLADRLRGGDESVRHSDNDRRRA